MKHKLFTALLSLIAVLCLCFGLAACDFGGSTNNGNTDDSEQGDTQKPDDGKQDPDDGSQKPDDGKQDPDDGSQNPDDGSQKPDDGEADSPYYTEGLNFTERYGEDGTTVVGYCVGVGTAVNEEHIVIPDVYLDLPVTSIGDYAFRGCSSLTSITIPDSVTSIGDYAFEGCYKLVEVWNYSELPIKKGKSSYGYVAYYAKQVYTTDEKSKQTVTDDGYIFYEDGEEAYLIGHKGNETSLTLPSKSPSGKDYAINQGAFSGCSSLTSIVIPDSVTSIGENAFYNTAYYNEESNWTDGVLYIGNHLIDAKTTISGAYTIRANTKTIAASAFV